MDFKFFSLLPLLKQCWVEVNLHALIHPSWWLYPQEKFLDMPLLNKVVVFFFKFKALGTYWEFAFQSIKVICTSANRIYQCWFQSNYFFLICWSEKWNLICIFFLIGEVELFMSLLATCMDGLSILFSHLEMVRRNKF